MYEDRHERVMEIMRQRTLWQRAITDVFTDEKKALSDVSVKNSNGRVGILFRTATGFNVGIGLIAHFVDLKDWNNFDDYFDYDYNYLIVPSGNTAVWAARHLQKIKRDDVGIIVVMVLDSGRTIATLLRESCRIRDSIAEPNMCGNSIVALFENKEEQQ